MWYKKLTCFLNFQKDKEFFIKSSKIIFFVSFSQIIISLIAFLDVFMTSAYGEMHFAAIGIAVETWFIFQAPIIGFSTLFGILYAQYKNNKKNFSELAKINMWFSFFSIFLISSIIFFLGDRIIEIFFIKNNYGKNINSFEVKKLIANYLKIISLGNIFFTLSLNLINPIIMIGKTIYIFYMSLIALFINFIFNLLLIYVADLGVIGAGWSTIISYFCEFIFAIFIVYKYRSIFIKCNSIFKLDKKIVMSILKRITLAFSSIIMFWTFVLSTIIFTIQYGVKIMQGLSVSYAIIGTIISIVPAIKKTVNILIGQELGKNNYDIAIIRSKKLFKIILLITFLFSIISIILALFIPNIIIKDREISHQAKYMIIIFGISLFAYAAQTYYSAILESGGIRLLPCIFNYWVLIWLQIPLIIILGPWVFNLQFIYVYLIQSLVIYFTIFPLYIAKRKNKWLVNLNNEIV